MARLKPWYQVVTPREDLRENRPLDASEFAVHLDHIRLGRAQIKAAAAAAMRRIADARARDRASARP